MRLLYLIKRPLVRRDYDRLGVGYFLSEGHQVSVLDLSGVIHPNLSMAGTDAPPHSNLIIHKVRNWKELRSLKPEIANSDLALLLIQSYGLARSNLPVLRLLAETKTPYLVQAPMVYPGWRLNTASQNFGQRLKDINLRLRELVAERGGVPERGDAPVFWREIWQQLKKEGYGNLPGKPDSLRRRYDRLLRSQ